jgi:transposase
MTVKTDRKDARGIAQLLRMGWYRSVHRKSVSAQEVRALLVGRKLLQGKLLDIEGAIRGILCGFGLKVGVTTKPRWQAAMGLVGLNESVLLKHRSRLLCSGMGMA